MFWKIGCSNRREGGDTSTQGLEEKELWFITMILTVDPFVFVEEDENIRLYKKRIGLLSDRIRIAFSKVISRVIYICCMYTHCVDLRKETMWKLA